MRHTSLMSYEKELIEYAISILGKGIRVDFVPKDRMILKKMLRIIEAWDNVYNQICSEKNDDCAKWHKQIMDDALPDSKSDLEKIESWINSRWPFDKGGDLFSSRDLLDYIQRIKKEKADDQTSR